MEIFEIMDNSEEEESQKYWDRKLEAMARSMGNKDKRKATEEQLPKKSDKVRRYGRGRGRKNMGGRGLGGREAKSRRDVRAKREADRGRGGEDRGKDEDLRAGPAKRPRKTMERRIRQAEIAYQQDTDPRVRRIIQNLEEEAIQGQSEYELEDWEFMVQDPGNTRGRMSLFKQSLHIYWVMKRLLAKALEQVATEMVGIAQGGSELKRELQFIHISLEMQERKIDELHQMLRDDHRRTNGAADQQPGDGGA